MQSNNDNNTLSPYYLQITEFTTNLTNLKEL